MNYFVLYSIYVLILSILMGLSTWKLFKKLGYNPIFAFIPFYNYSIVLKETKHPRWWVIFTYFPIVGVIMMSVFHLFLMEKFGKKSTTNKLLTIFLPFIYMAVANYSSKIEIEKEEDLYLTNEEKEAKKKDTFFGSITYAVVFATIVHTFVTQPFGIPTGSMEGTLLVGDFLFVNKWSYGYRMPMRPVAIPFLQSTITNAGKVDAPKSYIDGIKLPYTRIFSSEPKRNDIVVFNYPADSVHTAIDRKDPYVKRLVAVAGDEIEFRNGELLINGKPERRMGDAEVQHAYVVTTKQPLDISNLYKVYGFLPVMEGENKYYFSGLTDKIATEMKSLSEVESVERVIEKKGEKTIRFYPKSNGEPSSKIDYSNTIFPASKDWNPDWYGPLRIPKKGDVITLTKDNLAEYQKLITEYEGNILENKNGKFYINGKETSLYTVKLNYYMMIGDNRNASLDSRFFGFVPETHIIGSPMFSWLSLQGMFPNDQSDYQAPFKIRWNRMFKATNTGDMNKTSYWWVAVIVLGVFFGWEYIVKFLKKNKND